MLHVDEAHTAHIDRESCMLEQECASKFLLSARQGRPHDQPSVPLMQAGGASRVNEENRIAASQSPCQADDAPDMMSRLGNYLGSWVGLGSVPEHPGMLLWPSPRALM